MYTCFPIGGNVSKTDRIEIPRCDNRPITHLKVNKHLLRIYGIYSTSRKERKEIDPSPKGDETRILHVPNVNLCVHVLCLCVCMHLARRVQYRKLMNACTYFECV